MPPAIRENSRHKRRYSELGTAGFRDLTVDFEYEDFLEGVVYATPQITPMGSDGIARQVERLLRTTSPSDRVLSSSPGTVHGHDFEDSQHLKHRRLEKVDERRHKVSRDDSSYDEGRDDDDEEEEEGQEYEEEELSSQDMTVWINQAGFSEEAINASKSRIHEQSLRAMENAKKMALDTVAVVSKQRYHFVRDMLEKKCIMPKDGANPVYDPSDLDTALERIEEIHTKAQAAVAQIAAYDVLVLKKPAPTG
ncbi:hypothetical protein BJ508DRAFT_336933 [Ascobolus immersus RN42]|uniref:Uncharacterized protein n=1 Tax=Ascobolus immersus RN42 TaxID=1160509 RepID=A0A3N4H9K5_ASCIM|nr:hypothetical protein BJ508DRAFT_336933 [Ascobolus immersus RN42]